MLVRQQGVIRANFQTNFCERISELLQLKKLINASLLEALESLMRKRNAEEHRLHRSLFWSERLDVHPLLVGICCLPGLLGASCRGATREAQWS